MTQNSNCFSSFKKGTEKNSAVLKSVHRLHLVPATAKLCTFAMAVSGLAEVNMMNSLNLQN